MAGGQGQSDHSTEKHRYDHALLGFTKRFGSSRELKKQSPWGKS